VLTETEAHDGAMVVCDCYYGRRLCLESVSIQALPVSDLR
jgi:hypothetical protein